MKILIACEESQAVCKEFRKLGHETYSCDILPCSGGHPEWHIKGSVIPLLKKEWDMIIAFPPCTHLAVSGARHFKQKRKDGRQQQGIDFFMLFANAKCDKIAIENPVCIMSSKWRKPNQIIQPYMFGHEAKKTTCLWLKGLPNLKPTNIVSEGEFYISPSGKKMPKWLSDPVDKNGKKIAYNSPEIKILRSKTFLGIAKAMSEQWANPIQTILTEKCKANTKGIKR